METQAQTDVINFLATELRKIFPTSGIRPLTRNIIGETNVYLYYTNAASKDDCQSGILENDPAFMMFSIDKDRSNGSYYIDAPTSHGRPLKNAGVTFRKIKGTTEMACAIKLVEWFKKNGTKFLALGLR
ncbi:hypothetical protein Xoosp13_43 [Xanthomonas phage Xoo-sp13]|nr:hypothetical protein Xoosp13_43 [Xanthomonas phage Xoo-sp13]